MASASSSPVGRGLLLYSNGTGAEFMDISMRVILSPDGRTYRRLEPTGAELPGRLSPDGRLAVLGAGGNRLEIVELATGQRWTIVTSEQDEAVPLAVFPDGRRALVQLRTAATFWGVPTRDLGIVDLATGRVERRQEFAAVRSAALSPDGTTMVVLAAGGVQLESTVGGPITALPALDGVESLSDNAFSPDGHRLAVISDQRLGVLELPPAGSAKPGSWRTYDLPEHWWATVVGWTRSDQILDRLDRGDGRR